MTRLDEQDLRARLENALRVIDPARAPVDSAIGQGRAIRTRRRIGISAGAAILMTGLALVPVVLHAAPHSTPAVPLPPPPVVTVHPPGKHSPPGLISTGSINGKPWSVTINKAGTAYVTGNSSIAVSRRSGNEPAVLEGDGSPSTGQALVGPVRRDVTSVDLILGDGVVLRLQPVRAYGHRYVAALVPESVGVFEAVAFSARGEISHAIPFVQHGFASFASWLRPSQAGQQRVTVRIGSGVVAGHSWSAVAHLGPWGDCIVLDVPDGDNQWCSAPDQVRASGPANNVETGAPGSFPRWVVGTVGPSVSYLMLQMSDGSQVRLPAVRAGGQNYYALAIRAAPRILRWTAHSGSGRPVASGTGVPGAGPHGS